MMSSNMAADQIGAIVSVIHKNIYDIKTSSTAILTKEFGMSV